MAKVSIKTASGVLLAVLALIALAVVGQMWAAGYFYDKYIHQAVAKVEQKIGPLSLRYEEAPDPSLFEREGVISWSYALPEDNPLSLPYISGKTSLKVAFGPLKASGVFNSIEGQGNFDEFLAKFNLEPISYMGAFKATALMPRASVAVKTSAFSLPGEFGMCKIGESALLFEGTSTDDLNLNLNFAGFACEGSKLYSGKPSFDVRLEGLNFGVRPYIEDGKPYFDEITLALKELYAEFSTIFAVGFEPDEVVKDPTLRDLFNLTDFEGRIAFTDEDDRGRGILKAQSRGNIAIAFPYVKEGAAQEPYEFSDLKFAGRVEKINLKETLHQALHLKGSEDLPKIMQGFSKPVSSFLDELSFAHRGQTLNLEGQSTLSFDEAAKLNGLQLTLDFRSHQEIVKDFASTFGYQNELDRALALGTLQTSGSDYTASLRVQDKDVYLNGRRIEDLRDGEDVVEEAE